MTVLLLGDFIPIPEEDLIWSRDGEIRRLLAAEEPLDFVVSYNYARIIPPDICERYVGRIINVHTSMLPWNKGAHPNYWSWRDGTPRGVSIHQLTAGLDAGPILAQRTVPMYADDTLKTSYERLQWYAKRFVMEHWTDLRAGRLVPTPQPPGGEMHRRKDLPELPMGWDTPVMEILNETCHT